jgi:hypothetical protein
MADPYADMLEVRTGEALHAHPADSHTARPLEKASGDPERSEG